MNKYNQFTETSHCISAASFQNLTHINFRQFSNMIPKVDLLITIDVLFDSYIHKYVDPKKAFKRATIV